MTRVRVQHTTINITVDLRKADHTLIIADAADLVITLPPSNHATRGKLVTVVQRSVSAGAGLSVSPNAADTIVGQTIAGVAFAGDADDDLINTGATDVLNDRVTLCADGNKKWITTGLQGVWASEA